MGAVVRAALARGCLWKVGWEARRRPRAHGWGLARAPGLAGGRGKALRIRCRRSVRSGVRLQVPRRPWSTAPDWARARARQAFLARWASEPGVWAAPPEAAGPAVAPVPQRVCWASERRVCCEAPHRSVYMCVCVVVVLTFPVFDCCSRRRHYICRHLLYLPLRHGVTVGARLSSAVPRLADACPKEQFRDVVVTPPRSMLGLAV